MRYPNRSEDLAPGSERSRKARGHDVSRGASRPATIPEHDPDWCKAARMVWDAMLESGGSSYFESSDYATLYLTCDQIDHLYSQGGRRSPEYLRVIMQSLGSLLATEGDRRKLHIELTKDETTDEAVIASVTALFEDDEEED